MLSNDKHLHNTRIDKTLLNHIKLGCNNLYIKHLIAYISGKDEVIPYSNSDLERYCASVPNNLLEQFKLHKEVNFDLNTMYLVVLITHVLKNDTRNDNILAAGEFFMSELLQVKEEIPQKTFDTLLVKILVRLSEEYRISKDTLMHVCAFINLVEYDLSECIEEILMFLQSIIGKSKDVIVIDLENGLRNDTNEANIAFNTLHNLFQKFDSQEIIISNMFQCALIVFCKNESALNAKENFLKFFKHFLYHFHTYSWFKKRFFRALITIKDPMITVKLLKLCEKDVYNSLIGGLINYYITGPSKYRPYLQATMSLIISNPYKKDAYNDPCRQAIVNRIVHEISLRLGNSDVSEKEDIMSTFIQWYESKDINLRRTLQQMYNDNDETTKKISAKKLISILEPVVDIYWQNEKFNILFIKLILSIFHSKPQYTFNRSVRMIERLCLTAMAWQVEDCLPYFTKVIIKCVDNNVPILKPLLAILVNFALIQTETAKKFLFEIYDLIKNAFVKNEDADVEFAVISVLISPDMRGKEIFSAMELYFPITQSDLKIIFEERTLKYGAAAWPFLCMLLDKHEVDAFPIHFKQFILEIDDMSFYLKPEAIYIIQTIHKVFMSKMKKSISSEDKSLAVQIFTTFSNHVMKCIVPSKLANDVSALLASLCDVFDTKCPVLTQWIKSCYDEVMHNLDQENIPIITRKIAYLAHFLIPFKLEIPEIDAEKIKTILKFPSNINNFVLAKLILFYGRYCLKCNYEIGTFLVIIEDFLKHDDLEIQIVTLATFYDISKLRLEDFSSLSSKLMKLITSKNVAVQDATLKLFMELLTSNRIRLNNEEAIIFLLALVEKNLNVDIFLKDSVEKELLTKSEGMIKRCFIHLIFYLNNFRNNKYEVNLRLETTYSYEKRSLIYRYLFGSLQRQDQLNILFNLARDFNVDKSFEVLRDIVTLASYFGMENSKKVLETKEFYETYREKLEDLTKIKCQNDPIQIEFNLHIATVLQFLLKALLKIEKANKEMLPEIYNAIALLTIAYYKNVTTIVNENFKMRNLFCVYNSLFDKYQDVILNELISSKIMIDRRDWDHYIQLDL
ncbi:uncharacterized protein [Onthophagus taurus]|uniref:uncharacterized protein n=1 Tax=Onthophagus taurus TaxID=166361 RepID=UPI0039BDA7B4